MTQSSKILLMIIHINAGMKLEGRKTQIGYTAEVFFQNSYIWTHCISLFITGSQNKVFHERPKAVWMSLTVGVVPLSMVLL